MLKDLHDRTLKWVFDACFYMSELLTTGSDDEFPEGQSDSYGKDAAGARGLWLSAVSTPLKAD